MYLALDLEATLREAGAQSVHVCHTLGDALAPVERKDIAVAVLDYRIGSDMVGPVARRLDERGFPLLFHTGQLWDDVARNEWQNCTIVPSRPNHVPL